MDPASVTDYIYTHVTGLFKRLQFRTEDNHTTYRGTNHPFSYNYTYTSSHNMWLYAQYAGDTRRDDMHESCLQQDSASQLK